jgi:hypothetical protein
LQLTRANAGQPDNILRCERFFHPRSPQPPNILSDKCLKHFRLDLCELNQRNSCTR